MQIASDLSGNKEKLMELFRTIDKDGSGTISLQELKIGMEWV